MQPAFLYGILLKVTTMDIYNLLTSQNITFQRVDHTPVYTCEEANRVTPGLPGARTKNLFVKDRKGKRHFLIVVADHKATDLNRLGEVLNIGKLQLASSERLQKYLGLEPGAVTLLGIVNDPDRHVTVVIDEDVWQQDAIQCHPLVNTSTLVISKAGVEQFLQSTGHTLHITKIPERELAAS
ncbi:prolyl-tRNA synthetase associated domain-containing protein [Kistimonas asteriae]|uniref:prolyl-tRNA synthetase associated domain-containing protein n=1 Tax=Kistimonas asteriae TaxID=517724 RepID=UPI001FE45D13|nr:prolyl-tRNA synthetase associated domain-containing protein [Kistimonas asteriae]